MFAKKTFVNEPRSEKIAKFSPRKFLGVAHWKKERIWQVKSREYSMILLLVLRIYQLCAVRPCVSLHILQALCAWSSTIYHLEPCIHCIFGKFSSDPIFVDGKSAKIRDLIFEDGRSRNCSAHNIGLANQQESYKRGNNRLYSASYQQKKRYIVTGLEWWNRKFSKK